jgi:nucleoside-diphosphate-sugar epimerase
MNFRLALVTGAGGCVGRAIVRLLVSEGSAVNALDIDPLSLKRLVDACPREAIRLFPGTLANLHVLMEAAEGVEVVFHTAAKVHSITRDAQEEAEFFAVNAIGTENLLKYCAGSSLRAFVHFSTIAVYGAGEGRVISEATPLHPENAYARSKLDAEHRIADFSRRGGVRPTILRMALVYGEGERGNFSRMMRNIDAGRFLIIGDGQTRKSMIYVEDVARAALVAACSPAAQGEVFVLADPQPYTVRRVAETLARHLGVRAPVIRVPVPLGRAGGRVLGLAGRYLGFRPLFTEADVDKLLTDTVCDVSKIRSVLGFEPQFGLEEGVRRTVEAYRREQTPRREAH